MSIPEFYTITSNSNHINSCDNIIYLSQALLQTEKEHDMIKKTKYLQYHYADVSGYPPTKIC